MEEFIGRDLSKKKRGVCELGHRIGIKSNGNNLNNVNKLEVIQLKEF